MQQRLTAIQKQQGSLGWPGLILRWAWRECLDFSVSCLRTGTEGWLEAQIYEFYLNALRTSCLPYPFLHSVLNKSFCYCSFLLSFISSKQCKWQSQYFWADWSLSILPCDAFDYLFARAGAADSHDYRFHLHGSPTTSTSFSCGTCAIYTQES